MPHNETQKERDAFIEGFHGIPSAEELRGMSFVELASLLSDCEKGSAKFIVVEHELLNRKNEGQIPSTRFGAIGKFVLDNWKWLIMFIIAIIGLAAKLFY